jgi:hypothetical protein
MHRDASPPIRNQIDLLSEVSLSIETNIHSNTNLNQKIHAFALLQIQFRLQNNEGLEPLAEVERALLVVEVLHAPHPELLGLLL